MSTQQDLTSLGINIQVRDFLRNHANKSDYTILPLAGDASNRRYFRIVLGQNSYVLMLWEPFENIETYPFLSVHELYRENGINVPNIIALDPSLGLTLLEDLGDLTLERKFWETQDHSFIKPFYQESLDQLIKINKIVKNTQNKNATPFSIQFDKEKFLWELNYTRKNLIEGLAKVKLNDIELKELSQVFNLISESLATHSKYVVHRDYHSRNLMIKLGKVKVIDFQDSRMGPLQYDLASILYDSYVNLTDDLRKDLYKYFCDNIKSELNLKFSSDEFYDIFILQVIQRTFKACGSFASFFVSRQDKRYLKYIHHTLQTTLNFINMKPKLVSLADIIEQHQIHLMDFEES